MCTFAEQFIVERMMRTREGLSLWKPVSFALVFLLIWDLVPRARTTSDKVKNSTEMSEYCQSETFNVSCGNNEVLLIRSAFYGRMRRSRCITAPYPYIGCAAEVSEIVGARCTGRRHCSFLVPDDGLKDIHPCPGNSTTYLEMSFECVKGKVPTQHGMVKWSTYVYQTASVSGSKILYFNIPPYLVNRDDDHITSCMKQGNEIPILIQFGEYPPHLEKEYIGRLRLFADAAIELKKILPSDEGWYWCYILFFNDVGGNTRNETWIYLSLNKMSEYCQSETFNVSCGHDEVLLIRSAYYGRMRRSRCITAPYPYIGCAAEVSEIVGARCTGRRHCSFLVPDDGLEDIHPCPGNLSAYLEMSYECVKDKKHKRNRFPLPDTLRRPRGKAGTITRN